MMALFELAFVLVFLVGLGLIEWILHRKDKRRAAERERQGERAD